VLNLLRALSFRAEFVIVVGMAFGYSAIASLQAALAGQSGKALLSESSLTYLLANEVLVLIALAVFLHARGWTFERIGLGASAKESLLGIGLALIVEVVYTIAWTIAVLSSQSIENAGRLFEPVAGSIDPAVVIAVSILNPIFEEIVLCGYVITALKDRGPWTAINVSVAIRLVCHLYQGVVGIIFIVPLGLIFAYWYSRQGRLWPLIVAHVLYDFIPLIYYARL